MLAFPEAVGARLHNYLKNDAGLSASDVARAELAAQAANKRVDQALIDLGLLNEARLAELSSEVLGIPMVANDQVPLTQVLPEFLTSAYLAKARSLPLAADGTTLVLAMVDPLDDFAAAAAGLRTGRTVRRARISQAQFDTVFAQLYGAAPSVDVGANDSQEVLGSDLDALRDATSDAPVVRFVQEAIRSAVEARASDIHFRPTRQGAEMLFRIDGELRVRTSPDARTYQSVVSRLKILAGLDISERRLPQDGRIRTNVGGRAIDIRISTMPHVHGEGAVLRLLSRELAVSDLDDLGFAADLQAGLERLFGSRDGLILVTGPTGSGKTTTLHAALRQLIRPGVNVVTVEDPVEYRIDGASQIQVDDKVGLTFPRVLRSLLRQDPDIILVGEIRDGETAKIAVQAALTGHLVLATLHTNSALAAVPRLVDMGIEPYVLAAVLRGVLAQRLVRRRCNHGHDAEAKHCANCNGTGYAGRIAIGELAQLDAELVEALARSLDLDADKRLRLQASGYRSLKEDADSRLERGEIDEAELRGLLDVG